MKPVDQTRFYVADISHGNCMQAAVASILELDLEDVPNFIEADDFWNSIDAFLATRGIALVRISGDLKPHCHYLAYGKSPRDVSHAVVYIRDQLAHDPHPSRGGIASVDYAHLLVPLVCVDR